jgi:hypothetical protein
VQNARKRELLFAMQPYMSAMNAEKTTEAGAITCATGIVGVKVQNLGAFVYRESPVVATSAISSPAEFEDLYSKFAVERRHMRWRTTSTQVANGSWFQENPGWRGSLRPLQTRGWMQNEVRPPCAGKAAAESSGGSCMAAAASKNLEPGEGRAQPGKGSRVAVASVLGELEQVFAVDLEAAETRLAMAWEAALAQFHEDRAAAEKRVANGLRDHDDRLQRNLGV